MLMLVRSQSLRSGLPTLKNLIIDIVAVIATRDTIQQPRLSSPN